MSITISVSKKTEQKIRRQAAKSGQDVGRVVAKLVEDVWDERFPEIQSNVDLDQQIDNEEYENPFKPFIGMFASGKTDTSARFKEILQEDIKMPGGFGGD